MYRILLLLLVYINLYAVDKSGIVLYNETMFAKDEYVSSNYLGDKSGENETFQNILKIKYYNYISDDLFFNTLITNRYTSIDKEYSEDIMRYRFNDKYTYIESLYLSYRIYDELYISAGIFPFTNGSYNEISGLGSAEGTGIIKMVDLPLEAIFLTYKGSFYGMDTITRLGYGNYDNKHGLLDDTVEDNVIGTDGYYLTYDIYDGFDSFKFNLFIVDYVKSGIPIGDVDVAAIAYNKYFTESGVSIYGTLAVNHTNLDLTELEKKYTIPGFLYTAFPNAIDFGKRGHEYSYLYSLGIAKDIDSKVVESYNIGAEYTYAADGWITYLNNRYSDIQNYSYLHGDNLFLWITTKFTTDIALKTFYGVSNHDGLVTGNTSRSVSHSETFRESLKTNERYGMKLIIKF